MAKDEADALATIISGLKSGSGPIVAADLKAATAFYKQHQEGLAAKGDRDAARLDKLIDLGKFSAGLIFLVAAFVVFFAFCPADKRFDLIEKLIPLVAGLFGGFGLAKLKKE